MEIRLLSERSTYFVGMVSERQPPRRFSCLSVAPLAAAAVAPRVYQNARRKAKHHNPADSLAFLNR